MQTFSKYGPNVSGDVTRKAEMMMVNLAFCPGKRAT